MNIKYLISFILISMATTFATYANSVENKSLRFVVLSDLHIYTSGKIPQLAPKAIEHIVSLAPDIVLITGDHTNGNRGDGVSLTKVRSWYKSLDLLLAPLFEANIPVIPVVGNHDFYRLPHQQGYTEWATKTINTAFSILKIDPPKNPLFFNFILKGNEFFIFKLWKQNFGSDQLSWLNQNSRKPLGVLNRFGFGHVPLKSSMGRTSTGFFKQGSKVFNSLDLDIYFCGHEHLHWDESNSLFPSLRQIIVGTTSGTYNFPIRKDLVALHCQNDNTCEMPYTKNIFKIKKVSRGAGQQVNKQNWLLVTVQENDIQTESYTLDSNKEVKSFFINK